MAGSGRALGVSGWLVAAAVSIIYLIVSYDVTIRERGARSRAALAAAVNVTPGGVRPVVDERYSDLAAEAQIATGADLPVVDRRLEAAEREFPSDYRFTYERATLAVYGRAEHHEAFFHLRRAAEKAIGTERAGEMLDRLEHDGEADGRLRKLAVGHDEWSVLHEALEHRDGDRLWHSHSRHPPTPTTRRRGPSDDSVPARVSASSPLEYETPCLDALIALRQVPMDPGARTAYHRLRKVCLGGSPSGQPPTSAPSPRHH